MMELKCKLFDGEKLWDGAVVTVENGLIASVAKCGPAECGDGFLMPGLIDAHTHMGTTDHVNAMLQNGITVTCDVSAPRALVEASKQLEIVSSAGMAMGMVMNPKGYVARVAANGAEYIKVLLFNSLSIGNTALKGIVKAAHEKGLKVAVHATEVATVRQAVEANADILLHVPMKEAFPAELATTIAQKGIAVAPTLVMMEAFCRSGQFGYKESDFPNALAAVKLLHQCGVTILAGTDANSATYVPAVGYGETLHYELELLTKAGLPPIEVLAVATSKIADTLGFPAGRIAPGQPATMLLVEGRPDRNISDSRKIRKIWVKGEQLL